MSIKNVTLARMFFYVFKALEDSANHFLAEYGINNTHYIALMMIYSSEGNTLNPCKLSESLLSSRPNVTRLINELVENGWVERKGSMEDRRRIDLSLTSAGMALLEEILPRNLDRINQIWTDFSAEEIDLTENLLRKILSQIGQLDAREHDCQI